MRSKEKERKIKISGGGSGERTINGAGSGVRASAKGGCCRGRRSTTRLNDQRRVFGLVIDRLSLHRGGVSLDADFKKWFLF